MTSFFFFCGLFFNIPKLPLLKWKNKKEIWYHFMVLDILCSTSNISIVEAVPFNIVVFVQFWRGKKQPTPQLLSMLVFSENLLLSVSKYKLMHYCISVVLLLQVQLQHSRFFLYLWFQVLLFFFFPPIDQLVGWESCRMALKSIKVGYNQKI